MNLLPAAEPFRALQRAPPRDFVILKLNNSIAIILSAADGDISRQRALKQHTDKVSLKITIESYIVSFNVELLTLRYAFADASASRREL